jgi:hypothetical protein
MHWEVMKDCIYRPLNGNIGLTNVTLNLIQPKVPRDFSLTKLSNKAHIMGVTKVPRDFSLSFSIHIYFFSCLTPTPLKCEEMFHFIYSLLNLSCPYAKTNNPVNRWMSFSREKNFPLDKIELDN